MVRNTTRMIVALCVCIAASSSNAFADKICLKATSNKKTGKVTLARSVAASKCGAGTIEILDTNSLLDSGTLHAGATVTGVVGGGGIAGTLAFVPISLPKGSKTALKDADVVIAATANISDLTGNCTAYDCLSEAEYAKANNFCTGTFDAPTAAPGKLCVYIDVNYAAYGLEVQSMARAANPAQGSKHGAGLQWYTVNGSNSKVKASWAYKAP